jgi:hypothetical protein
LHRAACAIPLKEHCPLAAMPLIIARIFVHDGGAFFAHFYFGLSI